MRFMLVTVNIPCVLALATILGCSPPTPEATVEGTLRMAGRTLDNCLVQFLPEAPAGQTRPHATGVTDGQGRFVLRLPDQRLGASAGRHRVLVQDLSASTGIPRIDNGAVDSRQPPERKRARPSRVPAKYGSALTPLQVEFRPGPQVVDLEIKP